MLRYLLDIAQLLQKEIGARSLRLTCSDLEAGK